MPDLSWKDLNAIIHEARNSITKIAGIEVAARKLREELAYHLERIQNIVLQQAEGE